MNADSMADTGTGVVGTNMFAYCNNSPVGFIDPQGTSLEPSIKSAYYHDCFFYEKTVKEWYEYIERSIFDDTLLTKTIISLYEEYGDIYEAFDSLINKTGYTVSVIFFNILKVIDSMSCEYNTKWERFILKQIEKRNLQQSKNEVLVLPYEVVAFMVGRDSVGMNYRYNESSRYVYNI